MQPIAQAVICVLFAVFFLSPSDEIVSMTPPKAAVTAPDIEIAVTFLEAEKAVVTVPKAPLVLASAVQVIRANPEKSRPAKLAQNTLQRLKNGYVPPAILVAPTTKFKEPPVQRLDTASDNPVFPLPQSIESTRNQTKIALAVAERGNPEFLSNDTLRLLNNIQTPPQILSVPVTSVKTPAAQDIETAQINPVFQSSQAHQDDRTQTAEATVIAERGKPQVLTTETVHLLQKFHIQPERLIPMFITGDRVNVREVAAIDGEVVLQLNQGDKVIGTPKRKGNWQQVILAGRPERVWISANFLEKADVTAELQNIRFTQSGTAESTQQSSAPPIQ